ncbi:CRISPR-associated endonuclease Cas2 [Oceanivirga salmonicida]|nr:CRISPR-associated endonuclease Cas2 [Oceanivirga salmonicida]
MRMLLFFDLPTLTKKNMKEYRDFRKFLIQNGFLMLQESVYTKLLLNNTNTKLLQEKVEKNKPSEGLICVLNITEKQYQKMEYLLGNKSENIFDTDERIVIL